MSEINALVGHYRDKYGIESHVLRPMTIGPGNVDFSRRQVIAEALGNSMLRIYADYVSNGSARLIGITGSDMYPRAPHGDIVSVGDSWGSMPQ